MAGRGKWDGLTGWTYTKLELDALRQGLPPASGDADEVWRDWFFEASSTGVAGSATQSVTIGQAADGKVRLSGVASQAVTIGQVATGEGLTAVSGDASQLVTIVQSAVGAVKVQGAATQAVTVVQAAAGQVEISGQAAENVVIGQIATGAVLVAGVATQAIVIAQVAAGTVATLETETPARGGWVPIESERSRKHRERRARREREAEQELRRLLRKAYRKAQGIEDERAELVVVAAKEAASAPLPEVAGRIEGLAGDLAQVADLHNAVGLMHEIMRLRRLVAEIDAATIAANDDDEEDAMLLIALAA